MKPGFAPGLTRRDFLNGVALSLAGCATRSLQLRPSQDQSHYPPTLMGLRGSGPGSFEAAHALRNGGAHLRNLIEQALPIDEHYDLVIVGAGLSGLASAYFYRQKFGPNRRVLILDNHDDFGGHAVRNEFQVEAQRLLVNGGSQSIDSPSLWSANSKELLAALGVDLKAFSTAYDQTFYSRRKLNTEFFLDHGTSGRDWLSAGSFERPWREVLLDAPLSPIARRDIV